MIDVVGDVLRADAGSQSLPFGSRNLKITVLTFGVTTLILLTCCHSTTTARAQSSNSFGDWLNQGANRPQVLQETAQVNEHQAQGLQELPPFFDETPQLVNVGPLTDDSLADVLVEGNLTIETAAIKKLISIQPGRPASSLQIKKDLSKLYETKWFVSVEPRYRRTPQGLVLIYSVVERPMIKRVEYRGNKRIKTKKLEALTNLKAGSPYDVSANRESARRIEGLYREKGFPDAKVTLLKGNTRSDRKVVFAIEEGKKVAVTRVKFTGNKFVKGPLLRTKLRTKVAILGLLGGKFDPITIKDDLASLKQYYHGLGFFDVKVEAKVTKSTERFNIMRRDDTNVQIQYLIDEGVRYKLRKLELEGNQVFTEEELRNDLKLASGEYFSARLLNQDVDVMQDKYGHLGRPFAKVDAVPRFLEEPGAVDLTYRIDEDHVYRIRRINVHIRGDNPHTRETVVLNRILISPGDLADPKLIKRSEGKLQGYIFERGTANGPRVQISPVPNNSKRIAERVIRGQSDTLPLDRPPNYIQENNPFGDPFGRALSQPPGYLGPPYEELDVDVYATEARTGRLMFGVGVNSDAGIVGSVILEENNFDILRFPQSFTDLGNGEAWRGNGQRFRLEAIPGDIVSRYLVSWSDPYFLDTDYSLGVSGFYYNRFMPNWDEQRLGGRFSVGKLITKEWSVSGAIRIESVDLDNPDFPTPLLLSQSLGSNSFQSIRLSVTHDTRDTPFLPSDGHLIQASFEQAFGDFVYPRYEGDARQYFTTYCRPDGGGQHVLSLRLRMGWTGSETPIFERYYAGGYQSFRGFAFRGISPLGAGTSVRVGGRWMFLGGLQYTIPVTADETISVVGFTDFGTIENEANFDDFRATVGAGLRLTVPAMGPVPIALDWAIPVVDQSFDDRRLFSFYIGLTR